jgi:rhodanese-related sulfurtransferase
MNAIVAASVRSAHTEAPSHGSTLSVDTSPEHILDIFERAAAYAVAEELDYAGGVPPVDAWALVTAGAAILIDVRSNEERHFVGHVPAGEHVAWATGVSLNRNPRFVKELDIKVKGQKDQPILLLCRSGKRSALAAEAVASAGFSRVYNILEGFEGELDDQQQRGRLDGWRYAELPWVQD